MKLAGKSAQEYIVRFRELTVGQSIEMPSALPSVKDATTQLILTDVAGDWWEFEAFFMGIRLAKMTAEVVDDELELEEL